MATRILSSNHPTTSIVDSGLTPNSPQHYRVRGKNAQGAVGSYSATYSINTLAIPVPTGLTVTGTTSSSVSLSWNAVSVATGGYRVYRNGTLAGSPTGTSFTDTGRSPSTSYNYTVSAVIAGSESAQSAAVNGTTASDSESIIFAMDYSSGAAPDAGWTLQPYGEAATYGPLTYTRVPGGGPSGQDAYDCAQFYAPTFRPEFYGGQFRCGWSAVIEAQDPPRGASRFYRFRIRFSADTNFRGYAWGDGTAPSGMTNKLLLIGDGGTEAPSRVIVEYLGDFNPAQLLRLRLQVDGGEYPASTGPWAVNTWLNVQIEAKSSTTAATNDGAMKIWVNNNNYASPTNQYINMPLNPSNWKYVWLGGFQSAGLMADGVHTYRVASFEAATAFDSGWSV